MKKRYVCLIVSAVLGASTASWGETITVCLDGSCDFDTIQEAIDYAIDGDAIEIAAGTYFPSETIDTLGKAVRLRGVVGNGGAPMSILDGQGTHRVIQCVQSEDDQTVFENIRFQNGLGFGGGMYNFSSSPMLINCIFKENRSYAFCGGMFNDSYSSPTLIDCVFESNAAESGDGGGMYNYYNSSPTLRGCVFLLNSAYNAGSKSYGDGGGMFSINNSNPTLIDCMFKGNSAFGSGGGLYCLGGEMMLTGSTVCGNSLDQIYGNWSDNGGNTIAEECPGDSCPADLNDNGSVDGADLTVVLGDWGLTDSPADLNGDGFVGGADLTIVLAAWGGCP